MHTFSCYLNVVGSVAIHRSAVVFIKSDFQVSTNLAHTAYVAW